MLVGISGIGGCSMRSCSVASQAHHLLAQVGQQVVEEIERLALVLVQRILLAVGAKPDALAQMVKMEQMLLPRLVEDLSTRSSRPGA